MRILITGARGYIGRPLAFQLAYKTDNLVYGVDNGSREKWVENCGGKKQEPFAVREPNYKEIAGDLSNRDFLREVLCISKPDCIIHAASQPSMPYSQLNWERASFTQTNNLLMCLNLLWGMKTNDLKETRFIITTTTGIPGQTCSSIPETDTLNMAGSWYHTSRGFDSVNCALASRQWEQEVVELRTSIVYGIQTELMRTLGLAARFDTDFYFGTALNRFISQALEGTLITIYGKGEQVKPFISLEDTVRSIVNAVNYPLTRKREIFNQVTEHISIKALAEMVAKVIPVGINYIPNPRKEKEDFAMIFQNEKFLNLLGKKPVKMEDEIRDMAVYFRYLDKVNAFTTWTI